MKRVRLPPRPENIEQQLYELGCTQEQVERHLTALRHQQDKHRQYPPANGMRMNGCKNGDRAHQ